MKCYFINVTISEPNITFTTLKSQFSHGLAIRDHIIRVDLGIQDIFLKAQGDGCMWRWALDHLPHLLKQNRFNIELQQFCIIQIQQFMYLFVVYLVGVLVCCSSNLHWTSLLATAYKYCMMGRVVMVLYLHLCIESKSNTNV